MNTDSSATRDAAPVLDNDRVDLRSLACTRYDVPAGVIVFLVALPLCLGIALASGAPLFSGIIAGIVGGLVIPVISRSPLSVCGPAAGLTAIVLMGIGQLGSFEAFLMAVFLAGLFQLAFGVLRAGFLGALVPSAVIKGMLAAIGLILILKQIPHAIGYDVENFSSDAFEGPAGENTFTLFLHAIERLNWGAFIISAVSLVILIGWPRTPFRRVSWLPSGLAVVVVGTVLNELFLRVAPGLALEAAHLVSLPEINGPIGFLGELRYPDFSALAQTKTYVVAFTIAAVASIETLLCIEAVDNIDPFKRITPTSRELVAQGVGNSLCGLIGGLPVTSVIVRSSANVSAGGRTRMAAMHHGFFLLLSVMFLSTMLNRIPLACLAAILLTVGYKLAKPSLMITMYRYGPDQFIPFAATIVAILFTDLLRGVIFGLVIGAIFVLKRKRHRAIAVTHEGNNHVITFKKDLSFIHKPALVQLLRDIPAGSHVLIDGRDAEFIDFDIKEHVQNFQASARQRGIDVVVQGIRFRQDDNGQPVKRESLKVRPVVVERLEPLRTRDAAVGQEVRAPASGKLSSQESSAG